MSRLEEKVFPEFTEIHVMLHQPKRTRDGYPIHPTHIHEGLDLQWADMIPKDMTLAEFEEWVATALRQAYVAMGRALAVHYFKLPNGNFSDFGEKLDKFDERTKGVCYRIDPVKGLVEDQPNPTIAEQL